MTISFDGAPVSIGLSGVSTTTGSGGTYRVDDAAVYVSGNMVAAINDDGVVFSATEYADASGLGLGDLRPYHVHDNGDGTFNIYYQVRDADPLPTTITNYIVTIDLATGAATGAPTEVTSGAFSVTDNSMIYTAHSLPDGNIFVVPFSFEGDEVLITDADGTVLHTGDTVGGRGFSAVQQHGSDVTVSNGHIFYAYVDSQAGEAGSTYLQIFDLQGNQVVAPFEVSDAEGTGFGVPPSVQVETLSDGRVVVVWTDAGTQPEDDDGTSVWFKIYNSDGTLSVDSTLVNTITGGNQDTPLLIATQSGFIIGYTVFSFSPSFVNEGRLREYDNDGNLIDEMDAAFGAGASQAIRIDNNSAILLSGNAYELILPGAEGSLDDPPVSSTPTPGNDSLVGTSADELVDALAGDDTIVNNGGSDTFIGGPGTDLLITDVTGLADDVLRFDAVAGFHGRLDGTIGADEVSEIENFTMIGSWDATVTGDDADNVFITDSGMDTLDGGAGDDLLQAGGSDDYLLGGDGVDTLEGGDGDDTLDGGGSGDVIDGGDGYDIASYASADRSVRVDLQNPAISFNDAAGDTFISIEEFQTGDGIDQLRGDAGDNIFRTGGVSDRLYGRAGDDMLFGEAGADAFYGGLGADIMTGGDDAGRRDRYIYFNAAESGVGDGNRDVITDFVAGEDRIELSRIDADITQGFKQGFDFIGDAAFTGTGGELRYEQVGGNTIVQADRDGDGAADFEIELTGLMDLTESDFLI